MNGRWAGSRVLVASTLLLAGCSLTPHATPEDTYESDGVLFEVATDEPFSGVLETTFPDSDQLLAQTRYRDGLKHGVSEGYDEEGHRVVREQFVEGVRDGERTEWWPDGQVRRHLEYAGGELNGLVEEWNQEGLKVLREFRQDGRREGRVVAWHDNGQVKSEATYAEGALQGVLRLWHPNGQLEAEKSFRNGFPHGPQNEWYADGTRRLEMEWRRGDAEGEFTRWHPDGQVWARGHYMDGQVEVITTWAEDGKIEYVKGDTLPRALPGG